MPSHKKKVRHAHLSRSVTFWGREEVEEGVVGDSLGDGPDCSASLVLLLLLDGLQRDVLALRPVNRTPDKKKKKNHRTHEAG